MQYQGGKARIAKRIAHIINKERGGRLLWEPFMGGLWATAALGGRIDASDRNPVLASLYNAVRDGYQLPSTLTREEYLACKILPDTDPLKAFAGFGCSWGGKFFGGFAGGYNGPLTYVELAKRNVERHVRALSETTFACRDFFEREPCAGVFGYLDPPYRGTTGYGAWDSDAFEARVAEWVESGSTLYVSEYRFPFGEECFARTAKRTLGASNGPKEATTERLFRCSAT